MAPLIASCSTSKQAWEKLQRLYYSRSKSRAFTLKERLTRSHGPNQPVADYLNNLWSIANELTLIDSPVVDDDLVVHIVNNIGKDFKEIIGGVWARETSITFDELYDKLVDFEEYLKRNETLAQTPAITAIVTKILIQTTTLTKTVANLHHHHSLHKLPIDIIQIQMTNLPKIPSTDILGKAKGIRGFFSFMTKKVTLPKIAPTSLPIKPTQ